METISAFETVTFENIKYLDLMTTQEQAVKEEMSIWGSA